MDFPLLLKDAGRALREDLGIVSDLHRAKLVRALKMRVLGVGSAPGRVQSVECVPGPHPGEIAVSWNPPSKPGLPGFSRLLIEAEVAVRGLATEGGSSDEGGGTSPTWEGVAFPGERQLVIVGLPIDSTVSIRITAWGESGGSSPAVIDGCLTTGPAQALPKPDGGRLQGGTWRLGDVVGGLIAVLPIVAVLFSLIVRATSFLSAIALDTTPDLTEDKEGGGVGSDGRADSASHASAGRTGGSAHGGGAPDGGVRHRRTRSGGFRAGHSTLLVRSGNSSGGLVSAREASPLASREGTPLQSRAEESPAPSGSGRAVATPGLGVPPSRGLVARLGKANTVAREGRSSRFFLRREGGGGGGRTPNTPPGSLTGSRAVNGSHDPNKRTCGHGDGCLQALPVWRARHHCGRCQGWRCPAHTAVRSHGSLSPCELDSKCICSDCFARLGPAERMSLETSWGKFGGGDIRATIREAAARARWRSASVKAFAVAAMAGASGSGGGGGGGGGGRAH